MAAHKLFCNIIEQHDDLLACHLYREQNKTSVGVVSSTTPRPRVAQCTRAQTTCQHSISSTKHVPLAKTVRAL